MAVPLPVPVIVPESDYETALDSESQQLAVRESAPLMSHIDSGRDTPV